MYTYVFGYFPIACVKKKNVYMYFWVIFQQFKRKKKSAQEVQERIWATTQLYCEIFFFCIATFVLYCKRRASMACECIAIHHCIVT